MKHQYAFLLLMLQQVLFKVPLLVKYLFAKMQLFCSLLNLMHGCTRNHINASMDGH